MLRVYGLDSRVRVKDVGLRVKGFGFRVGGSGFSVRGFGFSSLGFGVQKKNLGCRHLDAHLPEVVLRERREVLQPVMRVDKPDKNSRFRVC